MGPGVNLMEPFSSALSKVS